MLYANFKKVGRSTYSHSQQGLTGKPFLPISVSEQGPTNLRALAAIAPDLRTLCLYIVQTFVEAFSVPWAEVRITRTAHSKAFALRWTATERSLPRRLTSTITLPLGSKTELIGTLRLAQAGRMTRAHRVAIANLAEEATGCIRNALRTDMSVHSAVNPDRLQLAAEIHHGIGHYLANAIMRLQLCQQHLVDNPTRAEELLRTSLTCAQVAMDAVRTTIRSLGNANAHAPQFAEILHSTVDRLKIMTTAQFHLDIDLVRPLPPAIVPGIAAVACEALTNAVKHADAQNISLKLINSDEHVMLHVIDDGKGFEDERQLPPSDHWSGFGLSLMRDQVHYLGGTFQIQSIPAQGTQVLVQINNRQDASSFQELTNALM